MPGWTKFPTPAEGRQMDGEWGMSECPCVALVLLAVHTGAASGWRDTRVFLMT